MKFVISRIDDDRKTFEIIQEVDALKTISCIKAASKDVSDQTVINGFCKCGFRNKDQDADVQTLDQDDDEEFTNLVKELAGEVDPNGYLDFDKDIASSIPADAGSIFWHQEIRKEITGKHKNPTDEVMNVSSDEDVDEEIQDPE